MELWEYISLYALAFLCFLFGIWGIVYEIVAKLTWKQTKGRYLGCFRNRPPMTFYYYAHPLVEYSTEEGTVTSDQGLKRLESWCRYSVNQYLLIYYNPRNVMRFRIKGDRTVILNIFLFLILLAMSAALFLLAIGVIT